jgi:hypothetical protein
MPLWQNSNSSFQKILRINLNLFNLQSFNPSTVCLIIPPLPLLKTFSPDNQSVKNIIAFNLLNIDTITIFVA